MKRNLLHTLALLVFALSVKAQTSFTDNTSNLVNQEVRSGAPIAVSDLNGDYLDDIIRLNNTSNLAIEYQNQDGTFSSFEMSGASANAWAVCVADIDNDGMCEIMSGGAYNGVALLQPMGDGSFIKSTLDGPSLFVQAMNFADANNDGFLDAFSCHDDGPSVMWSNTGAGEITYDNNEIIDFRKFDGGEQDAGNYGSVWTDFDSDGDLDLYIAKCRQGVNSPTDVRRINQLWVNDGNNNYTEAAAEHGLAIGWQSWTAEFQDIDNDGDFDCFLTNHDHESQLLENVNNQFIDITATSGISLSNLPVQAAMKDFDNDGFVDILVTGHFFHNNGDKTFTEINPNPVENIHSFGLGDLNHDGFVDIYAGYGNGFNGAGNTPDKLWFNDTNDNNWFAMNLFGQQSNRGGVGARIELRGDWGLMIREVRAGESYGIAHSLTQHFGLGSSDEIESVTVHWPSGTVDIIENPNPNEFLTLIENNCIALDAPVSVDGETLICPGETVNLIAPQGYEYIWSNGETTQMISIGNEGNYSVTISDETGCFGVSESIGIVVDPVEEISIEALGELSFCDGDNVELIAGDGSNYQWSNGTTTQSAIIAESGTYTVSVDGTCSVLTSESITVEVLAAADPPIGSDDIINAPGMATLSATGDNLKWYAQPIGGDVLGEGNDFETPFISETTSFYVEDALVYGGGNGSGGPTEHTGSSEFSGNQFNGTLVFDCYEPFTLRTVKVYTDLPGNRIIELRDINENVLATKMVTLDSGETEISLDFFIEPANGLVLSTNTQENISNFGYESPRLRRTSTNSGGIVEYPYDVSGVASLIDSNFGDSWYYFFYDWKILKESFDCVGPRTEVMAIVDEDSAVFSVDDNENIRVFPNPTSTFVNIEIQAGNAFEYRLMDMTGKILVENQINASLGTLVNKIDISDFAKGMYWIQFLDEEHVYNAKILVQ